MAAIYNLASETMAVTMNIRNLVDPYCIHDASVATAQVSLAIMALIFVHELAFTVYLWRLGFI